MQTPYVRIDGRYWQLHELLVRMAKVKAIKTHLKSHRKVEQQNPKPYVNFLNNE